jgi:putative transposase
MAEAFVKTFKRDYVYVDDRPDAQTVVSQLPRWFEDYKDPSPQSPATELTP